jgi:hypothetical protein
MPLKESKLPNQELHALVEGAPTSWRDVLSVHPAAELFPLMASDELEALGADIKKNGLANPIAIVTRKDAKDWHYQLLDGRNRLDAMELVGVPFNLMLTYGKCCLIVGEIVIPPIVIDSDPYVYVLSANIHRRHLTVELKRELIAKLLKFTPEKSDRQIAETTKTDHKTVASVRAEQEARGEIPHVETRTDSKGRQQPARKTSTKPPQVSEEVLHQRAAAAERIRALPGGNKVGTDSENASENAGDEQGRLRHHFEYQCIALRSEVEELKAQVRSLEDRGLRAVPLAKLVDELEHRLPADLHKKHLAALKALRGALEGHHLGPTLNLSPADSEVVTTKH